MRSAYAAQPMASRGMIVLMLPQPTGLRGRALLLAYRAGVEAAIDELDRLGLIDTSALGVIGFSAMGNVVQDLITFSRHRFAARSEEHTSELQSLMRLSYAVFCLKKK